LGWERNGISPLQNPLFGLQGTPLAPPSQNLVNGFPSDFMDGMPTQGRFADSCDSDDSFPRLRRFRSKWLARKHTPVRLGAAISIGTLQAFMPHVLFNPGALF
jgi:hypothetical protein